MGSLFGENAHFGDLYVGILQFTTMYCSNTSLKYVSFPFMVLAKSAKILPVVFTSWLQGSISLSKVQVMIGVTITAGLIIFNMGKMKGLDSDAENYFGIFLVMTSLLFDGYSSSQADLHQRRIKRDFAYHSMLYTNCVVFVANAAIFAYTMATNAEEKTLDKIQASPDLTSKVIIIALCGAIGQIFIYFTLSLHNGYKLGIITTTRKCFSVLISAFAFNHKFTTMQWVGVSMVLTSTVVEFFYGKPAKKVEETKEKK